MEVAVAGATVGVAVGMVGVGVIVGGMGLAVAVAAVPSFGRKVKVTGGLGGCNSLGLNVAEAVPLAPMIRTVTRSPVSE
jgi:hypothetical protein